MTPLSILDLAPINVGSDARAALHDTLAVAQQAETLGYRRIWLAEHHNLGGVASAATAVAIGFVAAGTRHIRVGAGGIMLPNHAPLVVAEQFGTLESLYPGRIDLGLGRAPGTDQTTARALRRHLHDSAETFPDDVVELQSYFAPSRPGQAVRAVPGEGLEVPVWLLGSSLFSAQLAAALGLPFAFASHFAPRFLHAAIDVYRRQFRPSAKHPEPYLMLGLNAVCADSDEEARYLFTSIQQRFIGLARGVPGALPPPVTDIEAHWQGRERAFAQDALSCAAVGSPETVMAALQRFVDDTGADELMLTAQIHDQTARLRSWSLLKNHWDAA